MNVILIGYRGCGKSTLGAMLADQIWKDFIDVDRETCKTFKQDSIQKIWDEHGQAKWREAESDATEQACGKTDVVIALGGGALIQPLARRAVQDAQDTVRIYLRCEPAPAGPAAGYGLPGRREPASSKVRRSAPTACKAVPPADGTHRP